MNPMRLMTWNCRIGGFHNKAKHIAPFRPDVLAVQEVEPLDSVLLFAGDCQPTCRDRVGDPAYPRRAIGVFSYTDTQIEPMDAGEPLYGFRRYRAQRGGLTFQVAAVWTAATEVRARNYRQAHDGITQHVEWIQQHPTVILGDFNDNMSFRTPHWRQLLDLMRPLGLKSAYHEHFGEDFGAETRPTHFHHGSQQSPFHIDYCFVPAAWIPHVRTVEVGSYDDWHAVSDHAPLIVDVNL